MVTLLVEEDQHDPSPVGRARSRVPSRRRADRGAAPPPRRGLGPLAAVGVGMVTVLMSISALGAARAGEPARIGGSDPGPPFSPAAQADLRRGLATGGLGLTVPFTPDTGRCEVVYRFARAAAHELDLGEGAMSRPEVLDLAAPGSSVESALDAAALGNAEVLVSLTDCVPYLVGKPY